MMWEHATNGLVTWSLKPFDPYNPPAPPRGLYEGVEERTVLFRRAISTDEWVKAWDAEHQPKKTLLGLGQGNSMKELAWLWLVEDRMKVGDAETMIASHEFGHAIGLDHISDTSSVMSEFYNRIVKCLTIADLEEFCDKHNCSTALVTTVCKPD